jgi:predicted phosphate transport protein (TIGR00153 family)
MTNVMAGVFGASPVMPLERHADIVHKCARKLEDFFAAVVDNNWEDAASVRAEIARLENEADDMKNQIRQNLPRSLFMPVPRQDLLELLLVQDKIANGAKDVSSIVLGRKLEIPEAIVGEFRDFVSRCVDATGQARQSVRELDELFTTGFRGAEAELVASMIEKLDEIENDLDEREERLRKGLYAVERDLSPVDVVFLYDTIGGIGGIADMAERVGRRLELLLSR